MMVKTFTKNSCLSVLITVICFHTATAQTRALIGLVKAENDFAALAASANTRDAFLANVNDSSLVFSKGQILKGKQVWTDRKVNATLLSWQPAFADISGGGDFGYTSGPWQFKKVRADEKPVAYGEYNTVWIKDDAGDWKVFTDMGVSHDAPSPAAVLKFSATRPVRLTGATADAEINALENKLVNSVNGGGNAKNILPFLSAETRLCREEHLPITDKDEIAKYFTQAQNLSYQFTGYKMANAKDMAVTYGSVTINDVPAKPVSANYMRVWKKEKDGWKVVLDVISQ